LSHYQYDAALDAAAPESPPCALCGHSADPYSLRANVDGLMVCWSCGVGPRVLPKLTDPGGSNRNPDVPHKSHFLVRRRRAAAIRSRRIGSLL
jgi:hypothetical protein